MTTRHGLCTNFGLCGKADGREPIAAAQEFVCPECGKPLANTRQGSNSGRRTALLATGSAVVVAGTLYALTPAAPPPAAADPSLKTATSVGEDNPEPNRPSPRPQRPTLRPVDVNPLPWNGRHQPSDHADRSGRLDSPVEIRVARRTTGTPAPVTPEPPYVPVTPTTAAETPTPAAPAPPSASAWPPLNRTQVTVELLTPVTDQGGSTVEATVRDGSYAGAIVHGRADRRSDGLRVHFDSIEYRGETRRVTADFTETPNAVQTGGLETTLAQVGIATGVGVGLDIAQGKDGKESVTNAAVSALGNVIGRMVARDRSPKVLFNVGTLFTLSLTDAPSRATP